MDLTVGIATWNRAALLRQTLASLRAVEVPAGVTWDVIVADNNSTDETRETVEDMRDTFATTAQCVGLTYVFEGTQGKSHALNRILDEARGQWTLLLDDDVRVAADWMRGYVDAIARHPEAAVLSGRIEPWYEREPTGREAKLIEHCPAVWSLCLVDEDQPLGDPEPTAGGPNMALRTEVAREIRFDVTRGMIGGLRIAGEDATMSRQIIQRGLRGWIIPDARVSHWTPAATLGVRRLWRWQMGIGRTWVASRGHPTPGRFGVAWWAWREMLRRALRLCLTWRPTLTATHIDAIVAAAQYWGYLTSREPA